MFYLLAAVEPQHPAAHKWMDSYLSALKLGRLLQLLERIEAGTKKAIIIFKLVFDYYKLVINTLPNIANVIPIGGVPVFAKYNQFKKGFPAFAKHCHYYVHCRRPSICQILPVLYIGGDPAFAKHCQYYTYYRSPNIFQICHYMSVTLPILYPLVESEHL